MALFRKVRIFALVGPALVAALLLAVGPDPARAAIRETGTWPGQPPGYNDYHETARPAQSLPAVNTAQPMKYTISVTSVPQKAGEGDADRIVLMAHLPEDAQVWIDGDPTTSTGKERFYRSPALTAGKEYHYSVRVAWAEDGHWVSKETSIPVTAGQMQCFFLRKAVTPADQAAEATANLAKLSPEDQKLAEAQKFCVVENETLLGAVGVPVKVMVKDQPVFLCCKACVKQAQADPDKTLAKVKELKAKNVKVSEK
jgi:uncharacterized protein (TIGR03000 family)